MQTSTIVQISIAIAVILLTVILFRKSTSYKQRVLLVGPAGSGKTTLALELISKSKNPAKPPSTRTSAALNVVNTAKTVLVDIPGHERICFDYLREQLHEPCKQVLYFIDHKQIQHSVPHFNTFLKVLKAHKSRVEYAVLLTKLDKTGTAEAVTVQRARNALEFELNKMRKSTTGNNETISLANITFLTCNHNNLSNLSGYVN